MKKRPHHFEMLTLIFCLITFPLLLIFLPKLENRAFTVSHSHSPRREVLYDTMQYFSPTCPPFYFSHCSCQLTEGRQSPMFHALTWGEVSLSELRDKPSKATLSSSVLINRHLASPEHSRGCSSLKFSACHCTHEGHFFQVRGKTKPNTKALGHSRIFLRSVTVSVAEA